ncbi:MAG: hypothetical protein ACREOC_12195 [Gemmatimonadales bacterium]
MPQPTAFVLSRIVVDDQETGSRFWEAPAASAADAQIGADATTMTRFDWRALGYATIGEAGLLVLAAFGGPHGQLGAVPWILQLPGILLVIAVPGQRGFFWRVAGMTLVQVALWYAAIAWWRRRRARERAVAPPPAA